MIVAHPRTLGASAGQAATESVKVGGGIATAAGAAASASWVPIVGPIVAGVTLGLSLIFSRKGPKQKVASTKIVDELEPILKQNLQGYMEGPRTKTSQAQALKNFDDAWAYLISAQACGSAELGDPGKRCISERSKGGKWDWFAYYRDPIAADQAKDDTVTGSLSQVVSALEATGQAQPSSWLLIAAAALLLVGVLS